MPASPTSSLSTPTPSTPAPSPVSSSTALVTAATATVTPPLISLRTPPSTVPSSDTLPNPSLSFLPELVVIAASAQGLLCYRGRASGGYYVCNPTTSAWAALPPPANAHGADLAVAIIFDEPGIYNFHADYRVICAYPIAGGGCNGIYGFETFSSAAWNWAASAEIYPTERILAESGVAAGRKTY